MAIQEGSKLNAIVPMEPRSITATIAGKYGMEAKNFEIHTSGHVGSGEMYTGRIRRVPACG